MMKSEDKMYLRLKYKINFEDTETHSRETSHFLSKHLIPFEFFDHYNYPNTWCHPMYIIHDNEVDHFYDQLLEYDQSRN